MEHRWSIRRPVTGSVIVDCPRHMGLIYATMRDISLGGMLVDTGTVSLPLNAPVALVFDLPCSEHRDAYCLQAMVVSHRAGGAGVMFLDPDVETTRAMRSALYGPPAAELAKANQRLAADRGIAEKSLPLAVGFDVSRD